MEGVCKHMYVRAHTHTDALGGMCQWNDLFRIQSVHLRRIIDPDGHWMNNATPAEGHSTIMFSLNKKKKKNLQGTQWNIWEKCLYLEQKAAWFDV